jgi:hypothetical protein
VARRELPSEPLGKAVEEEGAEAGRNSSAAAAELLSSPDRALVRSGSGDRPSRLLRWLGRVQGNQRVQRLVGSVHGEAGSSEGQRQPAREGRAGRGLDPDSVRVRLGGGRRLDSRVRSRVESAFGTSFGDVHVHTDSTAGDLAAELGARAFTVGSDIAFGRGEYRPGTPVGDAVIAHELAHVVQQRGGGARGEQAEAGSGREMALEGDAERSAGGAVISLWSLARERTAGVIGRARPRLKSGVQLQSCRDRVDSKAWWDEKIVTSGAGRLYVRPPSTLVRLQQLLRQVDVLIEAGEENVKKTPPGEKNWHYFTAAQVKTTQWTPKGIKQKVRELFPVAAETFVWKKTSAHYLSKVKEMVAEYRQAHPNSFSILQGRSLARSEKWPPGDPTCIATLNRGLQELYGSRTLQTAQLGDTVQDSTKQLEKRGMVAAKKNFPATYTGSEKRFRILDEDKDLGLSGAGQWVLETVKATKEDGVHVFVVNVVNGYHSASIVARKEGPKVVMAWKDQLGGGAHGTAEVSAAGIDKKLRRFCRWRYRKWVRDKYNQMYGTSYASVDNIPTATPDDVAKLTKAEQAAKSSVMKDISVNTLAKVKPV